MSTVAKSDNSKTNWGTGEHVIAGGGCNYGGRGGGGVIWEGGGGGKQLTFYRVVTANMCAHCSSRLAMRHKGKLVRNGVVSCYTECGLVVTNCAVRWTKALLETGLS